MGDPGWGVGGITNTAAAIAPTGAPLATAVRAVADVLAQLATGERGVALAAGRAGSADRVGVIGIAATNADRRSITNLHAAYRTGIHLFCAVIITNTIIIFWALAAITLINHLRVIRSIATSSHCHMK